MIRACFYILFPVGIWTALIQPSYAAKEACTRASGAVQQLVFCQSDALSDLDRELNELYGKVRRTIDTSHRAALIQAQKKWMRDRDACGDRPNLKNKSKYGSEVFEAFDCVKASYERRQKELAELLTQNSAPPDLKGKAKFRQVSSDNKIIFFDEGLLKSYEKLTSGKNFELEELELSKANVGLGGVTSFPKRTVSSCDEFLKVRDDGFGLTGNYGFGEAEPYLICDLRKIFRNARKPEVKLDEASILGQLSQSSVFHFPGRVSLTDGMGIKAVDDESELAVEVLALSDFAGDGKEDVLVKETTSNKGATHWYYSAAILALSMRPGERTFSMIMDRCGINQSCSIGGHRLDKEFRFEMDSHQGYGGVIGYVVESNQAERKIDQIMLPKIDRIDEFGVYAWRDDDYFLVQNAKAGALVSLPEATSKLVITGISLSMCLRPEDLFDVKALQEKGNKLVPVKITPIQDRSHDSKCDLSFGGLGIVLKSTSQGELAVAAFGPDSTAQKAGIKTDEILESVQEKGDAYVIPLKGIPLNAALAYLRGQIGTVVVLAVKAASGEVRHVEMTRQKVDPKFMAAPQAHVDAFSLEGRGIPLEGEAAILFEKSMHNSASPEEHNRLGELYATGKSGAPLNYNEAVFWYGNLNPVRASAKARIQHIYDLMFDAAEHGNSLAQLSLANAHDSKWLRSYDAEVEKKAGPKIDACKSADDIAACLSSEFKGK